MRSQVYVSGEKHGRCKISNRNASEMIRRYYDEGGLQKTQLAREYGISPRQVYNIVYGESRPYLLKSYLEDNP